MKGRQRLVGFALIALVAVAGAWVLIGTPTAKVVGAGGALGTILAEYCLNEEGGGASPAVTDAWCSMGVREIALIGPDRERVALETLVASESHQRSAGYQWIDANLVRETATLFLFPRPLSGAFHMCNVEAPLWIVWYREDGTPLDAQLMLPGEIVPASRCDDVYAPRRAGLYRYALEIGEDLAREHGLGAKELASMRLQLAPWMGMGR